MKTFLNRRGGVLRHVRTFVVIVALLTVLFPVVRAQSSPQSEGPSPRMFRILTVTSFVPGVKYDAGAGGKPTPLSISVQPFKAYPVPANNRLVLYREAPPPPDAPPGTPPRKQTVAEAELPARVARVLVVVIPAGTDPGAGYRLVVIDDDPAEHPAGKLRLINFSKLEAAVALNRDRHSLAAGRSLWVESGQGGVLVQVAAQKGGQWQMAFRGERLGRGDTRDYGLVFDYVYDPAMDDDPANPPPATVRFFSENAPRPKDGSVR